MSPSGTPVCTRDVIAWNWEHALTEMRKFCQSDPDEGLTVSIGTLQEGEESRTMEEIGNTQTRYLGTPVCSQATR